MARDYDVIVLAKTWLKDTSLFNFDCASSKVFGQDRLNRDGGGLSFLVQSVYNFSVLQDVSVNTPKVQMCGIKIDNLTEPRYFRLLPATQ